MIAFKINLLPPAQKEQLQIAELNNLLLAFGLKFIAILAVFALFLGGIFLCLFISVKNQRDLIALGEGDKNLISFAQTEAKIKEINGRLEIVRRKQKDLVLWSGVLRSISELTPSGISLTNFSGQTKEQKITILGRADNRADLLSFQGQLEQSAVFTDVKAPLSNLLRQTEVDFTFSFKPVLPL